MKRIFQKKTNNTKRTALSLGGIALFMFGFAFALVPLYDVLCDITGINGKTNNVTANESSQIDYSRKVTVEFIAYINPDLKWDFLPEKKRISVYPGQTHTFSYLAKNLTSEDLVAQAVPSVSPGLAAQYLKKTECFCFNRQSLRAGGEAKLPLVFYVDPEIPKDINILTLAYTIFPAKPESVTQQSM